MALRSLNSPAPDRKRSHPSMKKFLVHLPPGPNDENLDLHLGSNLPPRLPHPSAPPCKASPRHHGPPLPPPASPAQDSAPEVEYILSENLPDLDNVGACLSTLLERLDSKDWLQVCEAINNMRQLAIFHTGSLLPFLEKAIPLVIKAMKNPRSALCKTSIMASADLFKACQDAMLSMLEPLLLQLLLKASQDKRFVCEEAERALEEMTVWLSPGHLIVQMQPYVTHRNPRVRAKTAACFCRVVSRLGSEGIKDYGFRSLLQIAASQLNDHLPEARESARKLVADLYAAYPRQLPCNQPSDTISEQANPDQSQEQDWSQFCSTELSSNVAQAILRLTSAS